MKINVVAKNVRVSDHLQETIEKKVEKLGKYFSDDIEAVIRLKEEHDKKKTEVTIHAGKGMVFRAEDKSEEFYDGIDKVVSKLSTQMSRYKDKLQRKHKDSKIVDFAQLPDAEEPVPQDEVAVAKNKKFELEPMTVDDAVTQMEMVGHNFYVFLNVATDSVNVVYKRDTGGYGLLETTY